MLGRAARRIVLGSWSILALVLGWLVAISGTDLGSTILFATALLVVAVAVLCAGRAIDAASLRDRLVWVGRALGLLGAAVAISFPAVLYQEIAMLIGQSRALTYDIEAALWYEFRTMPLLVVPALVALRWARVGGLLFLLDGIFNVFVASFQPFGVVYPEAASSAWIGIPPVFITAALLLLGSTRGSNERRPGPSALTVTSR